jgi:phosphate transport system substrate-binding protein
MLRFDRTIASCLVVCVLVASWTDDRVSGQEANQPASVEELQTWLQSIDPYRPQQEATGTVQVFGSTSMDAMAHGWADGFRQFHPKIQVEISAAGTESALERLVKTPSGIAMLARPVTEAELDQLKQQGLKRPVAFVVAREALGVFVHATNPAQTISGDQLRAVFTNDNGTSLTWSLFGVQGEAGKRPIDLISRTSSSGTQRFLADFVFQQATLREGKQSFDSNAEVVKAVAENPAAIAICGLKCGKSSAKPLQLIAGSGPVPSDDRAVLTGQYPLTRPMTLVVDVGQASSEAIAAQEYIRYALCQAGQTQVILTGFFPVDLPLLRAGMQQLEVRR